MGVSDHLEVARQHGLFKHHGIDLGDGTIAHYLKGRQIIRSALEEFCSGQRFNVVSHKNASPSELTLKRALSRIGEERYNLLFNNCEHFANWCKTGKHRSHQMEDWLNKSSFGAIAIGQLMPAAFFSGINLLLQSGLEDSSSRQKAKQAIESLQKLREAILQKLESTIQELENWLNGVQSPNGAISKNKIKQTLLLKGQNLADQLNTLENVEAQIIRLLQTTKTKP